MNNTSIKEDLELESLIARVADEFRECRERGDRPQIEDYAARYPQAADLLRKVLGALELIDLSLPGKAPEQVGAGEVVHGTLGDFRILREIGRGGMGVVYEADQISLGRRVALKVLPFASTLDSKQLQRFKNEAQAAAGLHHTNIVPVHATGCERGVHFYAMQFIEGQSLAALIGELRHLQGCEDQGSKAAGSLIDLLGAGSCTPEVKSPVKTEDRKVQSTERVTTIEDRAPGRETLPVHPRSSTVDSRSSPFFLTVANLGIQAAEALEHAHSLGVIHRDIKPANLMVDARGNLWITDFGLAHCQGGCELTMTGDILGTLRYMSPEQALAKRVMVDERTDIYSLGVTLYELLTLVPAFPGIDRQEVLRQIAFEEPRPPRRLKRTIPAELETIVLKAMEKNAADRYATAQELADDLRRYLDNRPIRARRPSVLARVRKWAWRHRGAVSATVVSTVLVLAATSGFTAWQWRVARAGHIRAEQAEKKTRAMNHFLLKDLIGAADPSQARGQKLTVEEVLDKAAAKIDDAFPDQPEVEASVRLAIGNAYGGLGLFEKAVPHLRRALELRQTILGPEHPDTLQAIDDYGDPLVYLGRLPEAESLFQDGLNAARRALGNEHKITLDLLHQLAWVLGGEGRLTDAVELERQCLETQLRVLGPENEDTLTTMSNLAIHLLLLGNWCEAEKMTRESLRVSLAAFPQDHPMILLARHDLLMVLIYEGEAIEADRIDREFVDAAIRVWGPHTRGGLKATSAHAHVLYLQGKFKEAEELQRKVQENARLPGFEPEALLGYVLRAAGRWDEAETALREAVKTRSRLWGPEHSSTLHPLCALGTVLQASGKRAEAGKVLRDALDARRKVLPSTPDHAESLYAWAEFLLEEGDVGQAEEALREALQMQRLVLPPRHRNIGQTLVALGWAMTRQGRAKEGEPLLRQGLEICRSGYPLGHWMTADAETQLDWATATAESRLGGCLTALGQLKEAESLLLNSYQTLQDARGTPPQRRAEAADRIVKLYETWRKPAKAAEWRAKRPALPKPHQRAEAPGKGAGTPIIKPEGQNRGPIQRSVG